MDNFFKRRLNKKHLYNNYANVGQLRLQLINRRCLNYGRTQSEVGLRSRMLLWDRLEEWTSFERDVGTTDEAFELSASRQLFSIVRVLLSYEHQ